MIHEQAIPWYFPPPHYILPESPTYEKNVMAPAANARRKSLTKIAAKNPTYQAVGHHADLKLKQLTDIIETGAKKLKEQGTKYSSHQTWSA